MDGLEYLILLSDTNSCGRRMAHLDDLIELMGLGLFYLFDSAQLRQLTYPNFAAAPAQDRYFSFSLRRLPLANGQLHKALASHLQRHAWDHLFAQQERPPIERLDGRLRPNAGDSMLGGQLDDLWRAGESLGNIRQIVDSWSDQLGSQAHALGLAERANCTQRQLAALLPGPRPPSFWQRLVQMLLRPLRGLWRILRRQCNQTGPEDTDNSSPGPARVPRRDTLQLLDAARLELADLELAVRTHSTEPQRSSTAFTETLAHILADPFLARLPSAELLANQFAREVSLMDVLRCEPAKLIRQLDRISRQALLAHETAQLDLDDYQTLLRGLADGLAAFWPAVPDGRRHRLLLRPPKLPVRLDGFDSEQRERHEIVLMELVQGLQLGVCDEQPVCVTEAR
jgi:hypothetical protein